MAGFKFVGINFERSSNMMTAAFQKDLSGKEMRLAIEDIQARLQEEQDNNAKSELNKALAVLAA